MKCVEIDINYNSVEEAIKTLQKYVGQNASLYISIEPVQYEDQDRPVVNVEIPEPKGVS